jgi:hypothetical protein
MTKEESDYFEANAKRQLTQWGNSSTPGLHEYAAKVWSGLIRGYYLGRWSAYASALQNGTSLDFDEWETSWINKPGSLTKAPTTGDVNKYSVTLYNAANEYINENISQVKVSLNYIGNNKAMVTLLPLSSDLVLNYATDGSVPTSGAKKYDAPFETQLPSTIKTAAFRNNKPAGDIATVIIPVSYGKPVTVSPQPDEKYKGRLGTSLTDAVNASEDSKDGNWLGYEGENVSALISLGGNFKISKVALSYLQNSNLWIFAPHSFIVETSTDGITYNSAGIYEFDDNKWNIPAGKGDATVTFPETQASFVRLLLFSRGKCPENHPGAGKKAWMFIDEITVE